MVQDNTDPVIQRLILGELARQYREDAKIDYSTAERELNGYSGKLSKVENGTLGVDPPYVERMITLYNIYGEDADHFRATATDTRRRTSPGAVVGTSRRYVALERVATEIRMVYNEIPGLLQNSEYAHAVISRSPVVPLSDATAQAQARQARCDKIIQRQGPHMWIALGVDALYREVGGRDVLRRQLESLFEISEMPRVRLRFVPWSAGSVPGLSAPFTLLYIKPDRKIAFVASVNRTDYIKATGPYTAAFDQAWEVAIDEDDSAEILKERITALS